LDEVAQILGIRVGNRKNVKNPEFSRQAGFPTYAANSHIQMLLKYNYTVAIVDQVGENALQSYQDRRITRIITPGTIIEDSQLESADNNFLLSIHVQVYNKLIIRQRGGRTVTLAWHGWVFTDLTKDVSTGEFLTSHSNLSAIETDLSRIQVFIGLTEAEGSDNKRKREANGPPHLGNLEGSKRTA
jgi:DNA mismatch repair ATPase MutS